MSRSRWLGRKTLQVANHQLSRLDQYADLPGGDFAGPLFVVGLPRSGTTLVYELIVQAFDVNYLSRIFDYAYGLPNLVTRLTRERTRNPLPRYESNYGRIPGFFSPAENYSFWSQWFPETRTLGHYLPVELLDDTSLINANKVVGSMSRIAGRPYVFKNVYFSLSLEALLTLFKNAHIIVVERDVGEVAASLYKKRIGLPDKGSWWSVRPPFSDTIVDSDLAEQVAFQCVRSSQLMNRALTRINNERFIQVDYAEICEAPQRFISRVADWLGQTCNRRENGDIPDQFRRSAPARFPGQIDQRFAACVDAMRTDEIKYISAVDDHVKRLPRNGLIAG